MATYQYLPPSLSSMLATVVAKVSTEIVGTIGMDVHYKHNGFTALMNELVEDSISPQRKNERYPLVALIQPFEATVSSITDGVKVRFDMLICTLTTPTKPADTRETDNYDGILRPIYAELLSQLRKYPWIQFKGNVPDHTHRDIYHLGDDRGNKNGYTFPDCVDAILIEGMEFYIYPQSCLTDVAPCSAFHSISRFNSVNKVSLTDTGNGAVLVRVEDADFATSQTNPAAVTYTLDMGDGGSTVNLTYGVGYTYSIQSLADGTYIGTVTTNYGAQYQFEYTVRTSGGLKILGSFIALNSYEFNYGTLDCADYYNYPAVLTYNPRATNTTFTQVWIAEPTGNVLEIDEYSGGATNEGITHTIHITSDPSYYLVNILTANNNILENKTIITLNTL